MTAFVNDDGEYLDFSGDDPGLVKQAANFFNFQIKGDFSVTIKIPNNSVNRKVLGYYGPNQIDSPVFAPSIFTMVLDGNNIASGRVALTGSNEKEISCFFLSGNSNWFNIFQFPLNEVDYPDSYTVQYTVGAGNRDKSVTDGIIFPVIDYWSNQRHRSTVFRTSSSIDASSNFMFFTELHPFVYLHTVLKWTCSHAGVNLGGDLIEDQFFRKLIMSAPGPDLVWPDSIVSRVRTKSFHVVPKLYIQASDPNKIEWASPIESGGGIIYNGTDFSFTVPVSGRYRFDFEMFLNPAGGYQILINSNGVDITGFNVPAGTSYFQATVSNALTVIGKNSIVTFNITRTSGVGNYRLNASAGEDRSNVTITLVKEITINHYVSPAAIVPPLKAIDFIKYCANMFSCICTYDETSNTLSIDKLSSIRKEAAQDWSEYLVSMSEQSPKVAKHNFIKQAQTPEEPIEEFNKANQKTYGGGDIETLIESPDQKTLYDSPFGPSFDGVNQTLNPWMLPYIKFYELTFEESTTYSAVTSVVDTSGATVSQFTSTWNNPLNDGNDCVFHVESASGFYTGFAICVGAVSATTNPRLGIVFGATDTGTIKKYSISKVKSNSRVLIVYPDASVSMLGGANYFYSSSESSSATTAALAWFDKPRLGAKVGDAIDESLAIDQIRGYNHNLKDRFMQQLGNIYNSKAITTTMLLPLAVFQNFQFNAYIYLKTKLLTGYFLVQRIENYKDARTPVKVELLYG